MFYLIGIGILVFVFVSGIILPWRNKARIDELLQEVNALRHALWEKMAQLEALSRNTKSAAKHSEQKINQEPEIGQKTDTAPKSMPPLESLTPVSKTSAPQQANKSMASVSKTASATELLQLKPEAINIDHEQNNNDSFINNLATQLPVWLGAMALVLAGFFLVKYSIENNLMGPKVRIILGALMAFAFLISGHLISKRPKFANGQRISQALLGVGIAVAYLDLFAGYRLYDLIPNAMAFFAMAGVTALAVFLSLRHGMPIAILGLVGGFLTPILIESNNPSAPALFAYLFFVFSGLMYVIKQKNWWGLAIPTSLITFLWTLFWILNYFSASDAPWVSLFLIAVCISTILHSKSAYQEALNKKNEYWPLIPVLNYTTLGLTLLLMATIISTSNYTCFEWGFFAMISAATLVLARLKETLYGKAPWISLSLSAVLLVLWSNPPLPSFAIILIGFTLLFGLSAVLFLNQQRQTLLWGLLHVISNVVFFLIAYFSLHVRLADQLIPSFWGFVSVLLALSHAFVFLYIKQDQFKHPFKAQLLALYAVGFSTFLCMAFLIELEQSFASVAVSIQLAVSAWFYQKHSIKALRSVGIGLSAVFIVLIFPQILMLLQIAAFALVDAQLKLSSNIPMVQWPLLQLGLPATAFLCAAYFIRQNNEDGPDVHCLEYISIGLLTLMTYYGMRHVFHTDSTVLFEKASFFERGIMHNIIALGSLLCFYLGRSYKRMSFSKAGLLLAGIACFRIFYFDALIHNPLWTHATITGYLIFNTLLLPFALPIVWAYFIGKELKALNLNPWKKFTEVLMFILAFIFISLNVRFAFHGHLLNANQSSGAEIYTYSAVWLLFAIGLLIMSTVKKSQALYKASYAMLSLVVAKVFLYDASALSGLYRVVSLLGLGLSLIGISWFYSRFQIKRE
ncbi:MAG TPA: DUF2339 domain-containing protein [Oligoflexia bacterium]|nr:DUF2339 domain-containing protein [Oligoflexia bacterium]HMR25011.1 DUF2339 domain-containing protein [Oligoflexia bacterium]